MYSSVVRRSGQGRLGRSVRNARLAGSRRRLLTEPTADRRAKRLRAPHDRNSAIERRGRFGCGAATLCRRHRLAPPVPDTARATAGGMAAPLMLATSRLLASTGRREFGRRALAGVERAFRALGDFRRRLRDAGGSRRAGLGRGGWAAGSRRKRPRFRRDGFAQRREAWLPQLLGRCLGAGARSRQSGLVVACVQRVEEGPVVLVDDVALHFQCWG